MLARATNVCFYHANCRDGALAAALLKHHNPEVQCIPCWREKLPADTPDLSDKNVLFADLTPTKEVLVLVLQRARAVLVIDHHASELGTLETTLRPGRYIYNPKECGASLTWRWIYGMGAPMPALVQYIRALDLFDWESLTSRDPDAVMVCRAIDALVEPDVPTMLALLTSAEDVIERLRREAPIVMRVVDPFIAKALRSASAYTLHNGRGVSVTAINSMHLASWIAYAFYSNGGGSGAVGGHGHGPPLHTHTLPGPKDGSGPGAGGGGGGGTGAGGPDLHSTPPPHVMWIWYEAKGGSVVVYLRSNGSFDCQRYAKLFGGGGHPNTASFRVRDHAHMMAHLAPR